MEDGILLRPAPGAEADVPEHRGIEILEPLAGRWSVEIRWSPETHKLVGGPAVIRASASFVWIEHRCFLALHMGDAGSPAARSIIGRDDDGDFAVLYAAHAGFFACIKCLSPAASGRSGEMRRVFISALSATSAPINGSSKLVGRNRPTD
jgi:hypothetical protein